MINNIELIRPLLTFESADDFYFLQVIKRKKENDDVGSNSVVIASYYITSLDFLHTVMPEIILLCDFHNARAYINLNVRSFERIGFRLLSKISNNMMNRDFKSLESAYDSVCGTYGTGRDKKWVIDVDSMEEDYNIAACIYTAAPEGDKIVATIPTKNGYHLITKPFDKRALQSYPDIIHTSGLTLLYVK